MVDKLWKDPEGPVEQCCVCGLRTAFWTDVPERKGPPDNQVALCQVCAPNVNIQDLPSKAAWCAGARYAGPDVPRDVIESPMVPYPPCAKCGQVMEGRIRECLLKLMKFECRHCLKRDWEEWTQEGTDLISPRVAGAWKVVVTEEGGYCAVGLERQDNYMSIAQAESLVAMLQLGIDKAKARRDAKP